MSDISKTTGNAASPQVDELNKPIQYRQYDGSLSENAHDKPYMELTLNAGKHSDLVKKILRQRIEKRAQEYPRWPGSSSAGVRTLWIESRFWYDRERFLPDFDDDWRKYRARYLHSLELDPREPVHVPEYERVFLNPIRRFYMIPGDWIEAIFSKGLGWDRYRSAVGRVTITRYFMIYIGAIGIWSYMRWGHNTWEARDGFEVDSSARIIYADHPTLYPWKNPKEKPHDYHDRNFSRRGIYNDLRDFEDTTNTI